MNLIYRSLTDLIEFTILVGLAGGLVDLTRTMGARSNQGPQNRNHQSS